MAHAKKTLRNISGIEVVNYTADVENGAIANYKATVRIAFEYEE